MRHGCDVADSSACAAAAAAVDAGRAVVVPGALDVDAALEAERAALDGGVGGHSSSAAWSGQSPSLLARASTLLHWLMRPQSGGGV